MRKEDFDPIGYINEPRWHAMSLGLERIEELLGRLGDPQKRFKSVHVAGTNGKGSTCAFIASMLKAAGYKTGLFTSPYLVCFEERIRVDGINIPLESLRDVAWRVREAAEAMADHPTEFELMTACAFLYFAERSCDIAVVEVGLGGRLDSTNVLRDTVEACVIASISRDHCALLGDTLPEIAAEKAGIMKPGVAVVSAQQEPEVEAVLRAHASEVGAPISFVSADSVEGPNDDFCYAGRAHLAVALAGTYQRYNAALALEAADVLRARGWKLSEEALCAGLSDASWPGRFEIVSEAPAVVIDGAHNVQGMRVLAEELKGRYEGRRIIFVMGVLADKDYDEMLRYLVPLHGDFICIAPPNPRALASDDLCRAVENAHAQVGCVLSRHPYAAGSVEEGVRMALSHARTRDVVCICGSLYHIGEAKQAIEGFEGRPRMREYAVRI